MVRVVNKMDRQAYDNSAVLQKEMLVVGINITISLGGRDYAYI